jgi:DNA-binding MarR family transcriptional regulator
MMTTLPAIEGPPYVGALLRMCLQRVRARMQAAAREAGFTGLQDAHWAMITYPVAPGVRPSELARRAGMSRQAANHLIAQLESLGYFERRSPEGAARRLVFLTPRGEALAAAIHACLRELHAEWAQEVGAERFATLLDVLRILSRPEDRAAPAR